jgi:ferredoxin
MTVHLKVGNQLVIDKEGLQALLDALDKAGYAVLGPTVASDVLVYDRVSTISDFPLGWRDVQSPGSYRLEKDTSGRLFACLLGAQSWKPFFQPAERRLWRAYRDGAGFKVDGGKEKTPPYAFIGVRSCDLNAMAVQDKVYHTQRYTDPYYSGIRQKAFIAAVNCTHPGGTCFCASMGTGPEAASGFDVALTEVATESEHYFLADVGSDNGAHILQKVPWQPAGDRHRNAASRLLQKAASQMGRSLETSLLRSIFDEHFDDSHWEEVAKRCLTCGNCTMVCPTCFCCNIEDCNSLDGAQAERWRRWDSCFSKEFSYIHGGSIRFSEKARFRQWVIHKMVTWKDQFQTLGCVGCGRCITWCPVGIDITEEVKAIVKTNGSRSV